MKILCHMQASGVMLGLLLLEVAAELPRKLLELYPRPCKRNLHEDKAYYDVDEEL